MFDLHWLLSCTAPTQANRWHGPCGQPQEHKQKAAVSSSGNQSSDLVSYVEFQRNYSLLVAYHKAALVATRDFWRLLLRDTVSVVE